MKMKKAGALSLLLVLVLLLPSCGNKLDGTYVSQGLIAQSFTFDGDEITMSAFGINASGTYKISSGQINITYSLFGSEYTWSQPFSQSGNTITIGGTEFKKR